MRKDTEMVFCLSAVFGVYIDSGKWIQIRDQA